MMESELPAGGHERLQGHGGPGATPGASARTGAMEWAEGLDVPLIGELGRPRGRVPALGRLRRSHRPARAQDEPGAGPDPEGRQGRLRDPRLRGDAAPATRRAAWGTSTSSRSSPRRTSRRSRRYRFRKILVTCPHCLNSLGQGLPRAGRQLRRSCTTRSCWPSCWRPAACRSTWRRQRRARHVPRPLLPRPLQRQRSSRRARCSSASA